jgi:hypothetical protein
LRISETVDTGAQLYFSADRTDFLYTCLPFTDITYQTGDVLDWDRVTRLEVCAFSHG